jgi:hypothetical protein
MTEPIALNLTIKELQQIDKYIEYHDYDCDKPLLEKIRNAYPSQKSPVEEPYCPDEPEYYDEVEWDEKDNPKPMDEVVDRLIKKYQAQKLWNRVRDELGYSIDCCDSIVDLVEDWILDEQSAAGSQNVDVEFLVDGFNDCVRKMKEMLR